MLKYKKWSEFHDLFCFVCMIYGWNVLPINDPVRDNDNCNMGLLQNYKGNHYIV